MQCVTPPRCFCHVAPSSLRHRCFVRGPSSCWLNPPTIFQSGWITKGKLTSSRSVIKTVSHGRRQIFSVAPPSTPESQEPKRLNVLRFESRHQSRSILLELRSAIGLRLATESLVGFGFGCSEILGLTVRSRFRCLTTRGSNILLLFHCAFYLNGHRRQNVATAKAHTHQTNFLQWPGLGPLEPTLKQD